MSDIIDKIYTPEEFSKLSKEEQTAVLKKVSEIKEQQRKAKEEDEKNGLAKLSMKDFEGKIGEMVKKYIEPLTKVDRKFFMLPGAGTDKQDDLSAEGKFIKTQRFLKSLISGDTKVAREISEETRVKANLSEGTAASGGFLVPDEFRAEILRIAPTYGVLRKEARMIPMSTDVLNIPAAGTTDQSAIWTNEAGQILQTNPTFRQVTLTINKLAALPKVTNELLGDASIDIIQYLAELIAEAFAGEEDNQAFNGSGSPFVGCLQATGVPSKAQAGGTGWSALSYPDLVKATGELYNAALPNAKFYFHRTVIAHIRALITTAGAPIFGATANLIAGYPLVSVEKLPATSNITSASTTYAIFGDLRKGMIMGERGAMQMKISDQATVDSDNLFEKDMSALRMIERVTMGVVLPSSILQLKSAAS